MGIRIELEVDPLDLDIDYCIESSEEPVEFWGQKSYETYYEVLINSVYYKGKQIFTYDEDALEEWLLQHEEDL